jgi:hypothetical protein
MVYATYKAEPQCVIRRFKIGSKGVYMRMHRKVLLQRQNVLDGKIDSLNKQFIDGLSYNQFNKYRKQRRSIVERHGYNNWWQRYDVSKVTKNKKLIAVFDEWTSLVEEWNILMNRLNFELIDCAS